MEFDAIGTAWKIEFFEPLETEQKKNLEKKIHDRIAEFDRAYSRFRSDSLVTEMSKKATTYELPEDGKILMDEYKKIYDLTGSAVTPLIGKAMEDSGYDASYSFQSKELSTPKAWDEALQYEFPNLTILQPVMLDFGAGGKGYLIDIVGEIIANEGVGSFMVDAGGDILHRNAKKERLRVGLENPTNTSEAIGVAEILDQSICGSAGNRRTWGKYHHIIDPHKLESPTEILATWAIAGTTIVADLLSTALFFTSPQILQDAHEMEYLILYEDHSVKASKDFPGELFIQNP